MGSGVHNTLGRPGWSKLKNQKILDFLRKKLGFILETSFSFQKRLLDPLGRGISIFTKNYKSEEG